MKLSHIYNKLLGSTAVLACVLLTSCTGEFEKWNTNPNDATDEDMNHDNLKTGAYFSQMERGVFIVGKDMGGEYQITQALEGDLFASYFATITSWAYAPYNHDHYVLYDGWYNAPFNDAYKNIMQPWKSIYDVTTSNSPARAMATIVKVFAMHRITDMYGPIPYSKFGTGVKVAYDSQKDIYYSFFNELDTAVTTLADYIQANPSGTYLADYDNVYSGNVTKWLKFANTLRLRLAMRISFVDETKAIEEAKKAIAQSSGLLSTSDDDAALHQSTTLSFRHPIWEISSQFNDERMSATMECYLKGYNDPRLSAYFLQATATGEYKGVRNGMDRPTKSQYQDVTSGMNYNQNSDMHWMGSAEAYFLMAEAKLRFGLGSETVQQYYEDGIRASFNSAGVSGADGYIANSSDLPLSSFTNAYTNRSTNVSSMLSMLPVAWDDEADTGVKLERIMIQKWIALYPDGQEAWSEMRRTGYPGWVRIESYSHQSEVEDGEMISRLKFPTTEYANNSDNTTAAVSLLGGADKASTRLWWDVER